ncbi:MAG: GIY-YIG nuclease family protein [Candidatus Paceibacterota bacterium]
MKIESFKKSRLPDKPGVYFFKNKKSILYIGKATSLRDRVKSYFGKDLIETRGPILVDMVFNAAKIDWQVTDSVLEAIILEANLIKKYQPKYNTKEKSDKSFNYVCITREPLPKVVIVRGKNLAPFHFSSLRPSLEYKGGTLGKLKIERGSVSFTSIFGPYTSGSQLREAMKIIRRIFPFLDDKSKNYMEFYRQINLVPDLDDLPRLGKAGRKMYLQNIRNIKLFFEGKKKKVLQNLQKEMKEYAQKHEFEKAGEVKRQIFALQHINDIALLRNGEQYVLKGTLGRSGDDGQRKFPAGNFRGESENMLLEVFKIEAYDIAHMGGKNMVGVMTVVEDGEVNKSEYKKFKIKTQINANDTGALKEVLERRLRHTEWPFPSLIVVDGGVAQLNVVKTVLNKISVNIPVVSVVKDEKHNPKSIMGNEEFISKYKSSILLANNEAHRFAIAYHKNMRNKNFLK